MVATAAEIRESIRASAGAIIVNRSIGRAMHEAAVKPEKVLLEHERGLLAEPERERSNLVARAFTLLLGPKVRFLAGAALLAGCIAWMHQNAMISAEHAAALVEAAKTGDVEAIQSHAEAGVAHAREVAAQPTRPLDLPDVPPAMLALVSSFGAGVGGLILIVSSLFAGHADHVFRDSGRGDPGTLTSPLAPGTRRTRPEPGPESWSEWPFWRRASFSAADDPTW